MSGRNDFLMLAQIGSAAAYTDHGHPLKSKGGPKARQLSIAGYALSGAGVVELDGRLRLRPM